MEYQAPTREGKIEFLNINDLAEKAEKSIPVGGWGYLSGASGDEWTLRRNMEAFDEIEIYPRILQNL